MKYQESADTKEGIKPQHSVSGLQSASMNNINCVHSPYRFTNDDINTVVKTEQDHSLEVPPYHNNNNNTNFLMSGQEFHPIDKSHMYMPLASALTDLP